MSVTCETFRGNRFKPAAMLIPRLLRTAYTLAEILCVIGLLILCALKVQLFLDEPVSTSMSYQSNHLPNITMCNTIVNIARLRSLVWEVFRSRPSNGSDPDPGDYNVTYDPSQPYYGNMRAVHEAWRNVLTDVPIDRILEEEVLEAEDFITGCNYTYNAGGVNCLLMGGSWHRYHGLSFPGTCYTLVSPWNITAQEMLIRIKTFRPPAETEDAAAAGHGCDQKTVQDTDTARNVKNNAEPEQRNSSYNGNSSDSNSKVNATLLTYESLFTMSGKELEDLYLGKENKYSLLIHAPTDLPMVLAHRPQEPFFYIFENHLMTDVGLHIEQLTGVNRGSNRCNPDPDYNFAACERSCEADAHAEEAGCHVNSVWPTSKHSELPVCNFTRFRRLRLGPPRNLVCSCLRPCTQRMISANKQTSFEKRYIRGNNIHVLLRIDSMKMQVMEETSSYTVSSMLTDFGGNLGLTLGISLLTIVEMLKSITTKLFGEGEDRLFPKCTCKTAK